MEKLATELFDHILGTMELRTENRLKAILDEHRERYPLMLCVDVYKLIYQAANGPRHILHNSNSELFFKREWEMTPPGSMSIYELIDPKGELVRLNLARAKDIDLSPKGVWDAVVRTAESHSENPSLMKEYWEVALVWMQGKAGFTKMKILEESLRETGFVPIHHSEIFVENYHPAYRVVGREQLSALLKEIS